MRRSTLWICGLVAIATLGCKQVNEQLVKIKERIEQARARFRPPRPAAPPPPAPAPAQPATPTPAPTPPAGRPGRPAPPYREPGVPGLQAPSIGGRLADVPYNSPDTGTINPGMAEKDIYSLWGAPIAVRRQGDMTYLYFRNSCEYTCGTEDVVFLKSGQVVDAVLRWPGHGYSGQSSSPQATQPHARRGGDTLKVNPNP
jgi:hypothetical protein